MVSLNSVNSFFEQRCVCSQSPRTGAAISRYAPLNSAAGQRCPCEQTVATLLGHHGTPFHACRPMAAIYVRRDGAQARAEAFLSHDATKLATVAACFQHDCSKGAIGVQMLNKHFIMIPLDIKLSKLLELSQPGEDRMLAGNGSAAEPFVVRVERAGDFSRRCRDGNARQGAHAVTCGKRDGRVV